MTDPRNFKTATEQAIEAERMQAIRTVQVMLGEVIARLGRDHAEVDLLLQAQNRLHQLTKGSATAIRRARGGRKHRI